tara:strand:- start:603 stop:2003 length:1401 start_codon:yes stop_codon:yes gene_type:complete
LGTSQKNRYFFLLGALALLLPFQNCSNGFDSNQTNFSQTSNNGSSENTPGEESPIQYSQCGQTPHLGTETLRMYLQETGTACEGIDRTRTCRDGSFSVWSGSDDYPYPNCSVAGFSSCGNTPHGDYELGTFYENPTVLYGQNCGSGVVQRRLCTNGNFGAWDGSLVHRGCTVNPPPPPPSASVTDIRMFIFGHSLINHEYTPDPTEEKKVPHWLYLLAQASGLQYAADGQYGFMRSHADFSNIGAQWSFQLTPGVSTNENTDFSNVNYNLILSTPLNFVQYQAPDQPYYDSLTVSPLSATLSVFDQSRLAHPNIPFYIYENWPDMGGYGNFPGGIDIARYHNDTISGGHHIWFTQYHNSLLAARPGSNIKMIPVGPVISRLLRDTSLSGIPLTDLYEDNAPHGQPTLYFLASLVTYMAIYQTPAPASFNPPSTVHPLVRNNYSMVVNTIWGHLQNFNDSSGNSLVF